MIFFLFFTLSLLFSLRYLFLYLFAYRLGVKKSRWLFLPGFFLYLFFTIALADFALENFAHGWKIKAPFALLCGAVAGFPFYSSRISDRLTWKPSLFHIATFLCGSILIGINAIENLSLEKNILKICITGKVENRQTQWKNVNQPLIQSDVIFHEVILKTVNERELAVFYLPGDLVAVRVKTFRFPNFVNALGISTKYQLDIIYSGYRRAEYYNRFPIQAHPIPVARSFFNSVLFKYWEKFFQGKTDSNWIKITTLESNYFPMTDENGKALSGEFYLSISAFGISSANAKK